MAPVRGPPSDARKSESIEPEKKYKLEGKGI